MNRILESCRQIAIGRRTLLFVGLILVLGLALSGEYLAGQRQAYEDSAGQAARCREMAQRLMSARGAAPAIAHSPATVVDDSATIASAASAVGIAPSTIYRIEHDGTERIGSSPYVRRQTGISLKGVSLPQAVGLLETLEAAPAPLVARSLSIAPASDGDQNDDELWDITATVVSARYDPPAGHGTMARPSADRSAFP